VKWLDDYKHLRSFEEQLRKTQERQPDGKTEAV
jgi:hypothetical protein